MDFEVDFETLDEALEDFDPKPLADLVMFNCVAEATLEALDSVSVKAFDPEFKLAFEAFDCNEEVSFNDLDLTEEVNFDDLESNGGFEPEVSKAALDNLLASLEVFSNSASSG